VVVIVHLLRDLPAEDDDMKSANQTFKTKRDVYAKSDNYAIWYSTDLENTLACCDAGSGIVDPGALIFENMVRSLLIDRRMWVVFGIAGAGIHNA
jgi:hypothetical protein